MEGGLSRKRGYTVLVALLAAALLALLLWRGCRYENPTTETVPVDTAMLAELDMIGQPLTHSSVSRAASSPNLGEQPKIQLAPLAVADLRFP